MNLISINPITLETQKSQTVRIIDVLLLGPFLIFMATQNKISTPHKLALALIGLATIYYNGSNYLTNRSRGL